jgi:hypothetical protein
MLLWDAVFDIIERCKLETHAYEDTGKGKGKAVPVLN